MLSIEHRRPQECYQQNGTLVHRYELLEDGNCVGSTELVYRNDPFPFYYLFFMYVNFEMRGRGYGRELLKELNENLKKSGKTGLLRNIIDTQNPASKVYENNGWNPVEEFPTWFIYNQPCNLNSSRIAKAIMGIKEMENEGVFYHGKLNS